MIRAALSGDMVWHSFIVSLLNVCFFFFLCKESSSAPSTRPVTASGAGHSDRDAEGDLYIKYKKLQKQLEFLQVP